MKEESICLSYREAQLGNNVKFYQLLRSVEQRRNWYLSLREEMNTW